MTTKIYPKWDTADAISAAKNAYNLASKNMVAFEGRFTQSELNTLKENIAQLDVKVPKKSETLVNQKSKTLGQDEAVEKLRTTLADIRALVRGTKTVTPEIAKAYGIGEPYNSSIVKVVTSGNIVLNAFAQFTEWSQQAGILPTDMDNIRAMIDEINLSASHQDQAIDERKLNLQELKALQRTVEDTITRISKLGALVFRTSNPALAAQFGALIPSKGKTKPTAPAETPATVQVP